MAVSVGLCVAYPGGYRDAQAAQGAQGKGNQATTELKPCPFCGGSASLSRFQPGPVWACGCDGCDIGFHGQKQFIAAAWNRRADDWQPIEMAPKNRPVEVYAPPPDLAKWMDAVCDLPEVMCIAQWHPDAGFCVCAIREVTHWREVRRPLPEGPP